MRSRRFAILDEARPTAVEAESAAGSVSLSLQALKAVLGGEPQPQRLYRGEVDIPVGARASDRGIALDALSDLLAGLEFEGPGAERT
jgi:hypothetical protein